MNQTGKSLLVTIFITLAAFLSVGYTACKKTEATPSADLCATITCKNGGNCFKGKCTCPGGYEGNLCETKALGKYLGDWKMTETVTGSSRPSNISSKITYNTTLTQAEGSNVGFLLSNFMGMDTYDNVAGQIGQNNKMEYVIYSIFAFKKLNIPGTQVYITSSEGTINSFGSIMNGTYIRTYPDSAGFVIDSLSFSAERQ